MDTKAFVTAKAGQLASGNTITQVIAADWLLSFQKSPWIWLASAFLFFLFLAQLSWTKTDLASYHLTDFYLGKRTSERQTWLRQSYSDFMKMHLNCNSRRPYCS